MKFIKKFILLVLVLLETTISLKAQSFHDNYLLLRSCIEKYGNKNIISRSEIEIALGFSKALARHFTDDYNDEKFSELKKCVRDFNIDAALKNVETLNLDDTTRLSLLARLNILKINFNDAETYYDQLLDVDKNISYTHILEFSQFCRYIRLNFKGLDLGQTALSHTINTKYENLARINLAHIYFNINELDKAEGEILAIIKNKNKKNLATKSITPDYQSLLAQIYSQKDNIDSALIYYDLALKSYSNLKSSYKEQQEIYKQKCKLFSIQGNYDESIKSIEKAISLISSFKTETGQQVEYATCYLQYGVILKEMGNFDESKNMLNKSLDYIKENNTNLSDIAEIESALAAVEIELKDYKKAEVLCSDATNLYRELGYEITANILLGKASLLNTYGNLYFSTFKYIDARRKFEESIECYNILNLTKPNYYNEQKSIVLNNLGLLYDNLGEFEEALKTYNSAANIRKNINKRSAKYQYANTLTNIGNLYRRFNDIDSALSYLQQAYQVYNNDEPQTAAELSDFCTVCNNIAVLYRKTPNIEIAESFYEKASSICKILLEKSDAYITQWADVQNNRGLYYIDLGDTDLALYYLHDAASIREQQLEIHGEAFNNVVADSYDNLAYAYIVANNNDEALNYYEKSRNIRKELANKNPDAFMRDYCNTLFNLSNLYRTSKQEQQALNILKELKESFQTLVTSKTDNYYSQIANIDHNMALLYGNIGDLNNAIELMSAVNISYQALAVKNYKKYLPDVADSYNQLGNLYIDNKQYQESKYNYQKAFELRMQLADSGLVSRADVAATLNNLGILYQETNNLDSSIIMFNQARTIFKSVNSIEDNIEDVLSMSMNNLNIVQYYINENNISKHYSECRELIQETEELLSPYSSNYSVNRYLIMAQSLKEKISDK
ncbi:MAG: tetratricopeptide repeat protein [Bacteroidales bacterium]|nr:tetratricopeptide repeat protein [Bacteroidales bacterium]